MRASEYLKSLKSIWGIGVTATIIGPLALWVPDLQPPWPQESQLITAIFCIIVAILAFNLSAELSRYSGESPTHSANENRVTKILGCIALLLGIACGIGYLNAFNTYVVSDLQQVQTEARQIRIVVGTELRDELHGSTQPPLELLRDHGYDPESIWTRASLVHNRFIVFTFFVATFLLMTFGLGVLASAAEVRDAES